MGGYFLMDAISAIRVFDLGRDSFLHKEQAEANSVVEICSQEEFHDILVREKARADRNGHGFSLVAFETPDHEDFSSFVAKIKQRIRMTDEIGWFEHNTLGVFLYNTSAQGAWQFVNNNSEKRDDQFPAGKCSVYSYPNEWCTF
jgi:hypothetical protein